MVDEATTGCTDMQPAWRQQESPPTVRQTGPRRRKIGREDERAAVPPSISGDACLVSLTRSSPGACGEPDLIAPLYA